MPLSINGSGAITFNDASVQNTAATGFGFKNRIINGAMMVDQRNAGASVTIPAGAAYTVDRWFGFGSITSKFSVQQNAGAVTPPAGFTNYAGITSLSAYSVGSSEQFAFVQAIEGFNIADLGWGTANAQTVTLSFWVRSSLTGTFGGTLRNGSINRSYPFSYTITSANTWEQKTITIAGDTSGTWLTNNGIGILLSFGLGVGSTLSGTAGSWSGNNFVSTTGATSVVGTNAATWYITGVQLEKGSTATSFDYRPYGTELALCQRYFYQPTSATSVANAAFLRVDADGGAYARGHIDMPVSMRTSPTFSGPVGGSGFSLGYPAAYALTDLGLIISTPNTALLYATVASGLTSGSGYSIYRPGTTAQFSFSSEL